MPWKDKFNKLRNDLDNMISPGSAPQNQGYPYQQHQYQNQQQPYYPPPHQQYPPQGQYPPQHYQQQYHAPPPQQHYYNSPPPPPSHGPGYQPPQGYYSPPPPVPPHPPAIPPRPPADEAPPVPPHPPQPRAPPETYWSPRFATDTPISREWDAKLGNSNGWGNNELQHYTAESQNSFHTPDGKLVLRAIANSSASDPSQKYTSARLVSRFPLTRDRGVLSARILSPCAPGIWPAFWLLPAEPFSWPTDGEIDIAETWNGDCENRSCLHWGQHHEPSKHRVLGTKIPDMRDRAINYEFAWDQPGGQAGRGRMIWYIDGRPVMKADVPAGTRPLREMTILLNIAMGGNVCKGQVPADGWYDMVVVNMAMKSDLDGGWERFDRDWGFTPNGNTY